MPAERLVDVGHAAFLDAAVDRPAEQQLDRAEQRALLSVDEQHARVDRLDSKIAAVEFDGTAACALAHVSWVLVSTSSSSGTRSSADRRVDAVRQKASSVRPRRRSCSDVNFVGRVKSTARMRRRRCGAALLLGQPAFAGRVDERGDRVGAEDRSAHAATSTPRARRGSASAPPASRTVTRASADVDADRAAAVAAGLGRDHGDARGGELVAHGGLVALADLERAPS